MIMRIRTRWLLSVSCVCALAVPMASAADKQIVKAGVRPVSRSNVRVIGDEARSIPPGKLSVLTPGTIMERVIVGEGGGVAAGTVADPVYSAQLGEAIFSPGADIRIADDITTTGASRCTLDKFTLDVSGNVAQDGSPAKPFTEPFQVEYALYSVCPGSSFTSTPITDVSGTFEVSGTFDSTGVPDPGGNQNFTIVFEIPPTVTVRIGRELFLSVRFSRANAGVVVGGPALVGFSADTFDFPSFPCASSFGGFPRSPHATFNAEVFTRGTCRRSYPGYADSNHSGRAYLPGNSNTVFADDIRISVGPNACNMVAFEVRVKGERFNSSGGIEAQLHRTLDNADPLDGGGVPGASRTLTVFGDNVQVLRKDFSTPILLTEEDYWMVFKSTSGAVGPISTCTGAQIGSTQDLIAVHRGVEWEFIDIGNNCISAFDITIYCEAPAPMGACCDMVVTNDRSCIGGPFDGLTCASQLDCICPPGSTNCTDGTCVGESVCRDVPEINCPFRTLWQQGTICTKQCVGGANDGLDCTRQSECPGGDCPGPFSFNGNKPCGQSSCCTFDDACLDVTERECAFIEPVTDPRFFDRGSFCNIAGQRCPVGACLGREGDCSAPREAFCIGGPEDGNPCDPSGTIFNSACVQGGGAGDRGSCPGVPGCGNVFCCTDVCRNVDFFCCDVHWDDLCAASAATQASCNGAPVYDECAGIGQNGAVLIEIPSADEFNVVTSTNGAFDPGVCCKGDDPGGPGIGTIWLKFIAPEPANPADTTVSVSLSTCGSVGSVGQDGTDLPADDSLLQVFAPANPDRGICTNLATCRVSRQDCSDGSVCVFDEETACMTLMPIACNDDAGNSCASPGGFPQPNNSKLCMPNLTPGRMYYIMVSAKTSAHRGRYRMTIGTPCVGELPPPDNDLCANSEFLGFDTVVDVPFDLSGDATGNGPVTFDCPSPTCSGLLQNDLWFDWIAPVTGTARFDTCGLDDPSTPDTTMTIYEGCGCPVDSFDEIECNSFCGEAGCTLGSCSTIPVVKDTCYKVRIGGRGGATPAGDLSVSFDGCPLGPITFLDPLDGTVDARQTSSLLNSSDLLGIREITVAGPPGIDDRTCWNICETDLVSGASNTVFTITDNLDGTFTLLLGRPITPDAVTRVTYTDGNNTAFSIGLTAHAANSNADAAADTTDVVALIDYIKGTPPPHGMYSSDVDHSGLMAPPDILGVIDQLNGGFALVPALDTLLPACGICCGTP